MQVAATMAGFAFTIAQVEPETLANVKILGT
jgi:hypothetical protein